MINVTYSQKNCTLLMKSGIFWNLEIGNREIGKFPEIDWFGPILGIFPTQCRSMSMIVKSGFRNSYFSGILPEIFWKSGNFQKWACLDQFCHFGYIFPSVQVTEHDCEVRIAKFLFFWNFARNFQEIWKFPEMGWFGPIMLLWVYFPLS